MAQPFVVKLIQGDPPGPTPDPAPAPVPAPRGPADLPPGTQIAVTAGENGPKKRDGFYKPWDRFTKKKRLASSVPTLESDVEGRPGHPVESGRDGVVVRSQRAGRSYEEAVENCKAKVQAIRSECRRLNQKYYDRTFNLPHPDTLVSIAEYEAPLSMKGLQGIGSVKRVEDIYEDPEFFEDGATANDVRQGMTGDCWFLAAITALSGKPDLIERLCVDRDEKVGVYGFVFFRDGEWISEVIDDRLCLRHSSDDGASYITDFLLRVRGDKDIRKESITELKYGDEWALQHLPKEFRESLRKGSNALYFASSRTSNETWLPLLEKAYAKAHGDYQAIEGGFAGEGIEDLTGGIATYISTEDVLDKDQLWKELLQVNDKFLFGCGSRTGRDSDPSDEEGFVRGHAYTVLEAREIEVAKQPEKKDKKKKKKAKDEKESDEKKEPEMEKVQLLKLHNPWGKQEWNGAWSDGSKEWTPKIMEELNHTFGDDGLFWISYKDFLKFYPEIDRIRLVGPEWTITQQWTSVNVPWTSEYNDTSFKLNIGKEGPVAIVLSQLDDRYFRGLEGRYHYDLHFRLYKEGEDTYLLRSMEDSGSNRSCSAELSLAPGTYHIYLKVTARRYDSEHTPEEIIRTYRDARREKLLAIGKSFDLAHSKGRLREAETENAKKEKREEQEKELKKLKAEREEKRNERLRNKLRNHRIKAEEKRKRDKKVTEKKAELEAKKKAKEEEKAKKKAEDEAQKAEEEKKKASETTSEKNPEKASDDSKKAADSKEKPTESSDKLAAESKATPSSSTESAGNLTPESTPEPESKPDAKVDGKSEAKSSEAKSGEATQTKKKSDGTTQTEKKEADGTTQTEKQEASEGTQTDHKPVDKATAKEAPSEKKAEKSGKSSEKSEEKAKSEDKKEDHKHEKKEDEKHEKKVEIDIDTGAKKVEIDITQDGETTIDVKDSAEDKAANGDAEPAESEDEADPDVSDVSSVADEDFIWDDAMDGPVYSDFDSDADDVESSSDDEEAKKDDLYAEDPWNAMCVLGLRVCSLEDDVRIEVVRGSKMGKAARPGIERMKSSF